MHPDTNLRPPISDGDRPDDFHPSDDEHEHRMLMRERYDGRRQDMIELADDPFAGLELDEAYGQVPGVER